MNYKKYTDRELFHASKANFSLEEESIRGLFLFFGSAERSYGDYVISFKMIGSPNIKYVSGYQGDLIGEIPEAKKQNDYSLSSMDRIIKKWAEENRFDGIYYFNGFNSREEIVMFNTGFLEIFKTCRLL